MIDSTEPHAGNTASSLNQAYLALAREWTLWNQPLEQALQRLTEMVAASVDAQRASVWWHDASATGMKLLDAYDRREQRHGNGHQLAFAKFPRYFAALDNGRVIDAVDAHADHRTREFSESYLKPTGIGAMLDAPLRSAGRTCGVLCIEHVGGPRLWSEHEKRFVVSVADLVSQLLTYDQMRHNESLLAEAQAVAHLGNWDLNLATGQASWSDEEYRLLGYAPGQVPPSAEAFMNAVHPQDRAAVTAAMQQAMDPAHGGDYAVSHRVFAEDGQVRVVQQQGRVSFDAAGRPLRMFGTTLDVTERMAVEQALRDSEQRYRALFDNAGDAVFLLKGDQFTDCNAAALRMFGCRREQMLGQTPYRYSPPRQPDGRSSAQAARELLAGAPLGTMASFEWRHRRHDGSEFDAEVTLTKFDLHGEPHLLGIVRDITERKAAALALQHSSEELQSSNRRLRWINEASVRLHGTLDEQTVAQEAVALATRYLGTELGAFVARQPHDGSFRVTAIEGDPAGVVGFRDTVYQRVALVDRVHQAGGVLTCADLAADFAELPQARDRLLQLGMRAVVFIMLAYRGRELGLLALVFRRPVVLDANERDTLGAFGKTVSLALANARQADDLEHQAQHDTLTCLPNRARLHAEFDQWSIALEHAPDDAVRGALLLLDLDRFKEVNDTLGHHMGDRLLCKIGPRLQRALRHCDAVLCRLGGDEFAVLLKDVSDPQQVQATAAELVRVLRQPFPVDGMTLSIGASVGIALYPLHGEDSHALLRSADVAMYTAKHAGLGTRFYDPELDQHTPKRLALISDLDRAVHERQLLLHYQPKLDLETGEIVGFEALVRWQHPQLGLLYPGAFMALAEMSDVIHALTLEVLEQALAQQQRWRAAGRDYAVSVNLSARNLLDDRLAQRLQELIDAYGADPAGIELEITETALMADPEGAVILLNRIAQLGVLLSIDDYGTGYSSLAYLRRLPIYALKIDRTFVKDMLEDDQDAVIVRSTVGLAHNLDLLVVAEGVEDEATLALLGSMECDIAQGYQLSKPLPADAVLPWLDAYHATPAHRRY